MLTWLCECCITFVEVYKLHFYWTFLFKIFWDFSKIQREREFQGTASLTLSITQKISSSTFIDYIYFAV